jgi:LysM repeat protein
MFPSIWFWVVVVIIIAALWFGRAQIASYFEKIPMSAQKRTTNTQTLASATPHSSPTKATTATPAVFVKTTSSTGVATPRPTPRPAVTPARRYATYVVKKGDTLYSISRRYHTDVETLQHMNNISDPSTLYVGQELKVPASTTSAKPTQPVPKAGTTTYKVQKGDTLSSIARKFNTSVAELQKLNHFSNPNALVVGSVILVPAASKPISSPVTPGTKPPVSTTAKHDVHIQPVPATSSPAGATATVRPTVPTPTPTPTPIPTMPSVCDGAQEAVFVWGVSFCIPPGWDLQEYAEPHRPALISKKEESGDLSIYAISRLEGSPHAPLSWSMRQAKKSVSSEISSIVHGLAEPKDWTLATSIRIDDVEGQMSEARTTYLKTGHPARVRVIVFNHAEQRWRIVIVAPEEQWQNYNVTVFPYVARTLEVF